MTLPLISCSTSTGRYKATYVSFLSQLDYKVTAKKLREVFKMAGTVVDVDLKEDQDGKSRGMAVVKYEHPVEAVQVVTQSLLRSNLLNIVLT